MIKIQIFKFYLVYTVSHVYDGDTLTGLDSANKEVRVRLICIDAPGIIFIVD